MITTLAQHWPFLGGGFFAGSVAIGWVSWLFRRRRVVELPEVLAVIQAERQRIAADLHDDLGTRLTEIGLLSNSAAVANLSKAELQSLWERIGAQAESSVRSLDGIVWAINPANDCVSSVVHYFCLHAQEFLRDAAVACRLDVASNLANLRLGPEPRHELFLAFKEALNNVVRHAGATEVRIGMATRRNTLGITVSDNGRGLPNAWLPAGADGLRNMRERLARLGGTCVFRSAPGRGMTVEFRLPMQAEKVHWSERWRRMVRGVERHVIGREHGSASDAAAEREAHSNDCVA